VYFLLLPQQVEEAVETMEKLLPHAMVQMVGRVAVAAHQGGMYMLAVLQYLVKEITAGIMAQDLALLFTGQAVAAALAQ
jgi:hypothetical protein